MILFFYIETSVFKTWFVIELVKNNKDMVQASLFTSDRITDD